jgi:hypothetical protein
MVYNASALQHGTIGQGVNNIDRKRVTLGSNG